MEREVFLVLESLNLEVAAVLLRVYTLVIAAKGCIALASEVGQTNSLVPSSK